MKNRAAQNLGKKSAAKRLAGFTKKQISAYMKRVRAAGRQKTKTPFYYSSSIDRERELVRQRDGHTCKICGKKWEKGKRKFDVHHTEKSMVGKSNEKMIHIYDKENHDKLITLCHRCHIRLHKGYLTLNKDTVVH